MDLTSSAPQWTESRLLPRRIKWPLSLATTFRFKTLWRPWSYQLESFYLGFDVLPGFLLGWSGEEEGEGKEKEKTKYLKYKLFKFSVTGYSWHHKTSWQDPPVCWRTRVHYQTRAQSSEWTGQSGEMGFNNLNILKLSVTWQPDRSSNITENDEPENIPLALKYVMVRK